MYICGSNYLMMVIRKLDKTEYSRAASFSIEIYLECGQEDFDEEGICTFKSFVNNEQLMDELTIYGAFINENLIGIIGTKLAGRHLSLFFIQKEYHRKGIGRLLFNQVLNDYPVEEMTVNSSTYAIKFYQSLGFDKTDKRQATDGITYTPMKYKPNGKKQR